MRDLIHKAKGSHPMVGKTVVDLENAKVKKDHK